MDIAEVLEEVALGSIIHTAVQKPKVDFVREIITNYGLVGRCWNPIKKCREQTLTCCR